MRVLSYNIHKGFSFGNARFVLARIREAIREIQPDLVLLQEVLGEHAGHADRLKDWPKASQFEFLADELWPHFAYGKNAIYSEGHHGNAILSKFPITSWENEDISLSEIERRGILHATIATPRPVHAFSLHLGLFEKDRRQQLERLCARIRAKVPRDEPVIIGGDFNDWRERSTLLLREQLDLREAFQELSGRHARTFPSWLPLLRLDRIYFRGLTCESAAVHRATVQDWGTLSDHLPVVGEFIVDQLSQQ